MDVGAEVAIGLKFTSTGKVAQDVRSDATVCSLLSTDRFVNTEIETQVPSAYMANSAVVRGISSNYSDEELEGFLLDQVVKRARRRHRMHPTVPKAAVPTEVVILNFEPNCESPEN